MLKWLILFLYEGLLRTHLMARLTLSLSWIFLITVIWFSKKCDNRLKSAVLRMTSKESRSTGWTALSRAFLSWTTCPTPSRRSFPGPGHGTRLKRPGNSSQNSPVREATARAVTTASEGRSERSRAMSSRGHGGCLLPSPPHQDPPRQTPEHPLGAT